ncbi:proliferation marker protein Ki-67 isoform X2 [Cuculus canorus]|uniref:proliferation marker protein Ki-67 isoform X2 n=1 Tax=Cuculus canorus TaxID=55661 RepID=UPI0023AB0E1A|nr:proliferation marker protein Ki-67 isoform X2 [Cuculus canorus]
MPLYGNIIVIKRNGTDGITFPLTASCCLFGRRTECDIRIQLPQVSKEHCKIEVNENKEAILTNLSTVNPTQLNGSCFQEPVPLKHGDVLTIIDRSFRFEYPLQSTPRKRRSRTPKEDAPQVAEEELLQKRTSGSKSLRASDNADGGEKNADENKQSTEENISKALPIKSQTPKSSNRIRQSFKKQNEISPFSKLYEKLKHEIKAKKHLHEGNAAQQAAKEDGNTVLLEPSALISSSGCVYDLGSLTKEREMCGSENIEDCRIKTTQEVISSEFNHISVGSATRKSLTRSPRTRVSKEVSRDTGKSSLQDHMELSTADKSKSTEVAARPSKNNDGNAVFSLKQCPIESLDYAERLKIYSSAVLLDKPEQTTDTNVSEVDKNVLSTPTPRRKSPRSLFISPAKETSGMNLVNTDTPIIQRRASWKRKSFSEILAETQREDSVCRNDGLKQLPLTENKCLKQRQNSKEHTPETPVKEEMPKEICDQENFINTKGGRSETPVSLFFGDNSPRRNSRRSKTVSNTSVHSETPISEELTSELASPDSQISKSGRKRGRPRTSGLLPEKALDSNVVQEHHDKTTGRKDSGTKELRTASGDHQKLDSEDTGVVRSRRLSKRRSSGSATVLQDNEAVSEINISGLLVGEESGNSRRVSQKRKSGDLLLQPSGKRKRVSFGGHLSPELFDKSLPPNSPLKKGAIPARLSLPFGNSPRAVLKKAQGLKPFAVQEVSEHLQKEKVSPKHLPTQKSPTASPVSGKATPGFALGSPAPYRKGRFSISCVTTQLPIAEEKDAVAEDMNTREKNDTPVKTPQSSHSNQDDKTFVKATPDKLTRSAQPALKVTSTKRRSGAVAVLKAKRRSGASSANLLVAKSWAEVVKSGVARPQSKTVKKSVRKRRSLKKIMQSSKTPERKIKGHFSTGHAESPATIVVGRAYATTVRTAGQVPKVVKNPLLKLDMNMDESFTGMTEMFQTPEIQSGKTLPLAAVQKTDFTPTCTADDISELHTPEESGEMVVSPLSGSEASERQQNTLGICYILRDKSLKSMFDAISTKTPQKPEDTLEENISMDSSLVIPEKQASLVKSVSKRRTPKQKLEPFEVMSGIKRILRTPKQRSEAVEDLSGIKHLLMTPQQKPDPAEVLSGIKQLMRTPQQQPEPAEVLSGIKRLMRTPRQKPDPAEVLSGIKRLMRTPKQKLEPAEVLSGIKRLMRTPKQKPEPAEVLSGIKQLMRTPRQKPEPAEVLSGIKRLMRTPRQKPEPAEVLSGIKELMRTPQRKPEPLEVLSGIKQLMRTPQQELEPVTGELAFESLLKTPVQKEEAAKDVADVDLIKKTPKLKYQPVEDMIGISRIFKTPKEKVKPVEEMFGINRLMKTPREKNQPVDDFVGLQRLMAEPRQNCSNLEVDYVGVMEMFDTPEEIKVRSINVVDSKQEDSAPPCTSHKYGVKENQPVLEDKGNISQGEDSEQKESTSDQSNQRPVRGKRRKAVPPVSAKLCEKNFNLKELQGLEKMSTQEEIEDISTSTSVTKNEGRGRRTRRYVEEEIVSKHLDQEKVEAVSFVGPHGATQRPRRGKRKELQESKHPSENHESCGKDSSMLQKSPANMKQTLQEYGISDILETKDDPTMKTVSVSSSFQNENFQLRTGLEKAENKSNEGGVEDSEEMFQSPGRRSRRIKKVENTEPLVPPKRGRRARNGQVKQDSSEDLHGTKKLRKDPSANMTLGSEQTFDKDTETATAEESENRTELEIKITGKRAKSLRSARKHAAEGNADVCRAALENIENIQNTRETSAETDSEMQSYIKNQIKVSQGDKTENAQENTTEASQRLKAESPGMTNEIAVSALNLETNRGAMQETKRTRNRRGKKDSLEKKPDEFAEDVNNVELVTPRLKLETEMDESSLKGSLSSVCVKNTYKVTKDQNNPAGTSMPTANSDSLVQSRQKRARIEQGTEILQEKQSQQNVMVHRRGRGKKVNFVLEEASSKAARGKRSLPGTDEGTTHKDGQHETWENPASQVRRSRRKQVDSTPHVACSTFMEKQTLIADHGKDEAFVMEQDTASEATPSSTGDNPLRRGRRREVGATSQTSRFLSTRKRRGLLEGDDENMTVREDQNPALGNKTLQARANASARGKKKKIDLAAEAESSSSLQTKCGFSETDVKEDTTNVEQNMPLETVSCAKQKPLGRGRRKETALVSLRTNDLSLRGKCSLSADNGSEEAPKEDQNVPLETCDSSVKENQLRRGRRKETTLASHTTNCISLRGKRALPGIHGSEEAPEKDKNIPLETCDSSVRENRLGKGRRKETALLLEATRSIQGKEGLSKESDRKNNGKAKKLCLENSISQEKTDISEGNSKQTITSVAVSSTSLRELLEDGKNETPKEQQSILLGAASSPKDNPSIVGRKKTISSKSEETTSSTSLRAKPVLPQGKGQKRILKEYEDTSLENNSSQENTRQLRNKRKKVQFTSEAATSMFKNGDLPENINTLETQDVCLTSSGSEKNNQTGKEVNPVKQATSTSCRRKNPLPADDLASKKLKADNDENTSLPKERRNKTKEEFSEDNVRATRTAGRMGMKTRSSARTSARTRN